MRGSISTLYTMRERSAKCDSGITLSTNHTSDQSNSHHLFPYCDSSFKFALGCAGMLRCLLLDGFLTELIAGWPCALYPLQDVTLKPHRLESWRLIRVIDDPTHYVSFESNPNLFSRCLNHFNLQLSSFQLKS